MTITTVYTENLTVPKCFSVGLGAHGVWENKYKIAGFAIAGAAVAAAAQPLIAACSWGPAVCTAAVGATADKWSPLILDLSNGGGGTFSAGAPIGIVDDALSASGVTKGATSATNTVTGAPRVLQVGELKLPGVPRGVVGTPANTGKGLDYAIPSGTAELSESVASIRVMEPVTTGKYVYPNGYAVYMNAQGQRVNPLTGQMIHDLSDPFAHIPLP